MQSSYLIQLSNRSRIPDIWIPDLESHLEQYEIRRRLTTQTDFIEDPHALQQFILLWMKLYEQQSDPRYLNVALKGIDELMDKKAEGIALHELVIKAESLLCSLSRRSFRRQKICSAYEIDNKALNTSTIIKAIDTSLVILSGENASLTHPLVEALARVGIIPRAILIDISDPLSHNYERFYSYSLGKEFYEQYGHNIWPWYKPNGRKPVVSVIDTAKAHNIAWHLIDNVNSAKSEDLFKQYKPDICILSSVGIVKQNIIALSKIGILNAHSGILPAFRGIDTVAWSMLEKNPIGCSVHFIDEGVDTGDILFTHMLSYEECKSGVKASLKQAKIRLLLMALSCISEKQYERHVQDKSSGRAFFRMHPIIKFILNRRYSELGTKAFSGNVSIK